MIVRSIWYTQCGKNAIGSLHYESVYCQLNNIAEGYRLGCVLGCIVYGS